jgi:hypothetical protein
MKNGFYWAKPGGDSVFTPQVVLVNDDEVIISDVDGWVNVFDLSYFDFGPNPQPIEMPEWCKE